MFKVSFTHGQVHNKERYFRYNIIIRLSFRIFVKGAGGGGGANTTIVELKERTIVVLRVFSSITNIIM